MCTCQNSNYSGCAPCAAAAAARVSSFTGQYDPETGLKMVTEHLMCPEQKAGTPAEHKAATVKLYAGMMSYLTENELPLTVENVLAYKRQSMIECDSSHNDWFRLKSKGRLALLLLALMAAIGGLMYYNSKG